VAQVVLKLIQPYTRIRIPFVSAQLNIPEHDVEQLLVSLILDSRIAGHIDQAQSRLPHARPVFKWMHACMPPFLPCYPSGILPHASTCRVCCQACCLRTRSLGCMKSHCQWDSGKSCMRRRWFHLL
jgi:hypothetical protein